MSGMVNKINVEVNIDNRDTAGAKSISDPTIDIAPTVKGTVSPKTETKITSKVEAKSKSKAKTKSKAKADAVASGDDAPGNSGHDND